uniref:Putative secreted protein n=2 Tax=Anopheles marajoara TaxID=58244 RepID=A0A2M4CCR3_9DIPT
MMMFAPTLVLCLISVQPDGQACALRAFGSIFLTPFIHQIYRALLAANLVCHHLRLSFIHSKFPAALCWAADKKQG